MQPQQFYHPSFAGALMHGIICLPTCVMLSLPQHLSEHLNALIFPGFLKAHLSNNMQAT
jgi:hypothetical protein